VKSEYNINKIESFPTAGSSAGWFNQRYKITFQVPLANTYYYPMCSSSPTATYNGLWMAQIAPTLYSDADAISTGYLWVGSPNTYQPKSVSVICY
jgi:hypothetical protein